MDQNVILVLGVTGSGKSVLIRRLEDNETTDYASRPTRGAEPKKIGAFTFLEVGGELQPLWQTYTEDAKGIIFVFDAKATNQIAEAAMGILDLKAACALPIVLYIRSADSAQSARVVRDAFCLQEFDFICENGSKHDLSSLLKFCHQTNKV